MKQSVKKRLSLLVACVVLLVSATPVAAWGTEDTVTFGSGSGSTAAAAASTTAGSGGSFTVTPSQRYKYSTLQSSMAQYKESNADVVGWLIVPGTNINTVIVQSETQKDNVYYNSRDWQKTNYPNLNYLNYVVTSTFLDYRVVRGSSTWKSNSRNTVIYGHNWTNLRAPFTIGNQTPHVMFAQLPSYKDVTFAKENPYIYYSTENMEGVWKVFAAGTCEVDKSFYYNNPNPTAASQEALIKEWKQRSDLTFDVDVNADDRLLTLSTCIREYDVGNLQRYVVVARLLRPGETENDPVNVSVNTNKKVPTFSK